MDLDPTIIAALVVLLIGLTVFTLITWSNSRISHKHTSNIIEQQRLVRTHPDVHRLSQAVHLLRPSVRPGFDYIITHEAGKLPYISEWDTFGSPPTQAEIDEALRKIAAIDSTGYAAMRRSEYPSIEDQLDAAYKARRGDDSEQQVLDSRIAEIKSKYPKPDAAP